ncbi:UNVERIFIED_CONTAM: hypothetical protein Sindi_1681400 [Sesamum indicum]
MIPQRQLPRGAEPVLPYFGRGQRRSIRKATAAIRRLIDEDTEEEERENEGEDSSPEEERVRAPFEETGTPESSSVDKALGSPLGKDEGAVSQMEGEEERVPQSPTDWGSSTLRTTSTDQLLQECYVPSAFIVYYPSPVAHIFQVPLNQLVPNSFKILASVIALKRLKNDSSASFPIRGYPSCLCAENIMFSKLLRDHIMWGRVGGTPTPKSTKGAPTSSNSRGKRPSSSFSPGPMVESSSKKPRTGSMGTPPSHTSSTPAPAPPSKNDMDTPARSSRLSSIYLHSHHLLDQDKG